MRSRPWFKSSDGTSRCGGSCDNRVKETLWIRRRCHPGRAAVIPHAFGAVAAPIGVTQRLARRSFVSKAELKVIAGAVNHARSPAARIIAVINLPFRGGRRFQPAIGLIPEPRASRPIYQQRSPRPAVPRLCLWRRVIGRNQPGLPPHVIIDDGNQFSARPGDENAPSHPIMIIHLCAVVGKGERGQQPSRLIPELGNGLAGRSGGRLHRDAPAR